MATLKYVKDGTVHSLPVITAIRGGGELEPLDNPASAGNIVSGYEAYSDTGEKIVGSAADPEESYNDGYSNGHTDGYNEGYSYGYNDGYANGVELGPLSYSWDGDTQTLTITEVV